MDKTGRINEKTGVKVYTVGRVFAIRIFTHTRAFLPAEKEKKMKKRTHGEFDFVYKTIVNVILLGV